MKMEKKGKNKGVVESVVEGGWGLVRSKHGVVFLNYVLPGEEVYYRIREKAKGILWGEVCDIITPSEYRIEAPCSYFGVCGGCVFQHVNYSFQKKIKQEIFK